MKTENPEGREKRYVLLGLIGTGTTAEIYRCRLSGPQGFEKLVALKRLLPQWAKDPVAVADFIDEARLAALLNHENIAQVYDFGETEGSYFLSMEYLSGKDLEAVMQRARVQPGGMPAGHALYTAARICAGMEYAHSRQDLRQRPLNLIHRELSPDNIIVTFDGKVKIIDFGCARADLLDDRRRMGMMKGKIPYMSPEQLAGVDIDQRADIFTIGILLYEMLSGRRMYSGDSATMIRQCRNVEYARLEKVAGKLPSSVYAIVEKALQPDRNLRYQSCGQMLADIEACLSGIQPRPSSHLLEKFVRDLFAGDQTEEKKKQPGLIMPAVPKEKEEAGYGQIAVAAGGGDLSSESSARLRLVRPPGWFSAGGIAAILVIFLLSSEIADEDKMSDVVPEPPPQAEMALAAQAEMARAQAEMARAQVEIARASQAVADLPQQAGPIPAVAPIEPAKPPGERPEKRPIPQDTGRAKKIEDLLAQAATAWKEKRITEPEKDCAFWCYSKILALDPKNTKAWQGIERVSKYYADQAEQALSEHKFQKAEQNIQRGLQVFPDNRRLVALQDGMGTTKQQYIADLVGKAAQALQRDNLTTPVEDCAYTYYKRVLKLDKRNDEALDGIDRIADRYAELAEDSYRNLKLANCREFVKSGLSVAPHHPKLLELEEDLSRSMPGIFFKSLEKSFSTIFE